ncbi:MAG: hypothetical protein QOK01_1293 [Alphaproteobacteria bacterium]|nr:hypothetical protein [Alphaproteobacteria bacterium]
MPLSRLASPAALVWFLGGVLLAFFLYLIATVGRIETAVPNHDAVAVCIEKHKATTGVTTVSVGDLYGLNGFCYDTIGSQLKIDQEKIRRDNFLFQRNENVVLLYMVVLITISGVVLAGVQLLASYKLAVLGRGELAGGSEINYSANSISFKSSVIGLTILAMSFAFFLVFVIYVYDLRDISDTAPRQAATQQPANLVPVLPPPDQLRAVEAPPSELLAAPSTGR